MIPMLAIALSSTLLAIGLAHAYWGTGGTWPMSDALTLAHTVVGRRGIRRMPPPTACFAVATVLVAMAIWPLVAVGMVRMPLPPWLIPIAGAGMALVFLCRGIAAYLPAWRRIWPEQPFAALDRKYYGPLCLALGLGCLILLINGPTS